jgi:magnesium-transporting ATPase (P-type)
VLTGDKVETAINIGYSSGLLDNNMIQLMVTSVADKDIFNEITDGKREIDMGLLMKKALIVSGDALT